MTAWRLRLIWIEMHLTILRNRLLGRVRWTGMPLYKRLLDKS